MCATIFGKYHLYCKLGPAVLIMIMIKTLPKMVVAAAFFVLNYHFRLTSTLVLLTFVFNLGQRKNE